MNLMKEGLFERMTLGRHATKPASVCDVLQGATSGRCARVVFAGEGWDDFVKRCLMLFACFQKPSAKLFISEELTVFIFLH